MTDLTLAGNPASISRADILAALETIGITEIGNLTHVDIGVRDVTIERREYVGRTETTHVTRVEIGK